jgi:hypothetical protein
MSAPMNSTMRSELKKTARLLETLSNLFPNFKVARIIKSASLNEGAHRGLPRLPKKASYLHPKAYDKYVKIKTASEGDREYLDEDKTWVAARMDAEGFEFLFRQNYLRDLLSRSTSNKTKSTIKSRINAQLATLNSEIKALNMTIKGEEPEINEVVYFKSRFDREPSILTLSVNKAKKDPRYKEQLKEIADAKSKMFTEKKKQKGNPLRSLTTGSPRAVISRALQKQWWRESEFRKLVLDTLGQVSGTKLLANPMIASRERTSVGRTITFTLMALAKTHPEAVMEKARDVLLGASTSQILDAEGNVVGSDLKPNNKSIRAIAEKVANHDQITFSDVAEGNQRFRNYVKKIVNDLVLDIQRDFTLASERGKDSYASGGDVRSRRTKDINSQILILQREIDEIEKAFKKEGYEPPVDFAEKQKRLQSLEAAKEAGAVSISEGYFGDTLELGGQGVMGGAFGPEGGVDGDDDDNGLAALNSEAESAIETNLSMFMDDQSLNEIMEALSKPRSNRSFDEVAVSEDALKGVRDRLIDDILRNRDLDPEFHDYYTSLGANARNIFVRFCHTWTNTESKKVKVNGKPYPNDPARQKVFKDKLNAKDRLVLEKLLDQRELDVQMGKHIVHKAEEKFKSMFKKSEALQALNAVFARAKGVSGIDQIEARVLGEGALTDETKRVLGKVGLDAEKLRSGNANELSQLLKMAVMSQRDSLSFVDVIRELASKDDLLSSYFASIETANRLKKVPNNILYNIVYRLHLEGVGAEAIGKVLESAGLPKIKVSIQAIINEIAESASGDFAKERLSAPSLATLTLLRRFKSQERSSLGSKTPSKSLLKKKSMTT